MSFIGVDVTVVRMKENADLIGVLRQDSLGMNPNAFFRLLVNFGRNQAPSLPFHPHALPLAYQTARRAFLYVSFKNLRLLDRG